MSHIVFIQKIYNETLTQLIEARNYTKYQAQYDISQYRPIEGLYINGEMLRITTRLSEVMSWVLAQKSVAQGELSALEARCRFSLSNSSVCIEDSLSLDSFNLPAEIRGLLKRSRALYMQVSRLEKSENNKKHDEQSV